MKSKFLIFDVDQSLAAIGGKEGAKNLSGLEPLVITDGILQIRSFIAQLFRKEVKETKHPIFEGTIKETVVSPTTLCTQLGLSGIVIDTISHSFRQDMRILEKANKSGSLEMQDWGKLERMYNEVVSLIRNLPCWVVVNSHISYDKDQQSGLFYFYPGMKGSSKESIMEYFDLVLYTKASRDGKKVYTWQTVADSSKFAKDRLNVLENTVPQDFGSIIRKYREKDVPYPKILVIGESGTGKTTALRTLPVEELAGSTTSK